MTDSITIKPSEIRAGDKFVDPDNGYHHWTATEDAAVVDDLVIVQVQFRDGGFSSRTWNNHPGVELPVVRKAGV